MNEGQSKKEKRSSNPCTQKHNHHYKIIFFAAQRAFLKKTCKKFPSTLTTFFGKKKPRDCTVVSRLASQTFSKRVPYAKKTFGDDIVKSDFFTDEYVSVFCFAYIKMTPRLVKRHVPLIDDTRLSFRGCVFNNIIYSNKILYWH